MPFIINLDTIPKSSRLSNPALETLAIIAYRQPIGRIEIEYIRGVSSAGVIRTLIDRGLATIIARGEGIGRPLLYGTTSRFLEHFGFRSLDDLPRPEEMPVILRDQNTLKDEFIEKLIICGLKKVLVETYDLKSSLSFSSMTFIALSKTPWP